MNSPITNTPCPRAFEKDGEDYYLCPTGTLFTRPLDQSGMVGGTGNRAQQNHERLKRLPPAPASILDYGCGNGEFVSYMQSQGRDAAGYDAYSNEFGTPPARLFDVVTLIEVVEHLTAPFADLDKIYGLLNPGGMVYIETSFSNWVGRDHPYCNPKIGHCTIFSHIGLDVLMYLKGFRPGDHVDNNSRVYLKH